MDDQPSNMSQPELLLPPPEQTRARILGHVGEVVLRIFDPPEDYGFWLAPFSAAELEQWWMEQDRIPFHWDPNSEFAQITCRVFGVEPEKYEPFVPPGVFLFDGSKQWFRELWKEMKATGKHYQCVLCCDTDSYLQRPDGTRVFHRGSRYPLIGS